MIQGPVRFLFCICNLLSYCYCASRSLCLLVSGSHVKSFFEQLAQGESAGGVTTIGDRAVAGARKMLGLQSAGTAGLVQMVNDLVSGDLSNSTTTALIQAVSDGNPEWIDFIR